MCCFEQGSISAFASTTRGAGGNRPNESKDHIAYKIQIYDKYKIINSRLSPALERHYAVGMVSLEPIIFASLESLACC